MHTRWSRMLAVVLLGGASACGSSGGDSGSPTTVANATTTTIAEVVVQELIEPPDPSTIITTEQWGDVYDRRVIMRLADGSAMSVGDEVAAALGASVTGRIDEYLIVEIEIPEAGESAIAAALAALADRGDVLLAAPLGVATTDSDSDGTCGPLDSIVLEGDRRDQFRMIGVEDAWRLVHGSGVSLTEPTVGVVDGFGPAVANHGQWVEEVIDASSGKGYPGVLDAIIPDGSFNLIGAEVFGDHKLASITTQQAGIANVVARGATVVNISIQGVHTPAQQAQYSQFLADLEAKHPDVLVIAAAGNYEQDISSSAPGGLPTPNLLTAGGLNHEGGRYHRSWTDAGGNPTVRGSNYVGTGGEVTLAAMAQDVFVGTSGDGAPTLMDGTSFAAPQVTSAAAVLKALDPSLTGAELKQILRDTAATDISDPEINERIVAVDPALGGRVLRIDNAVWHVLSERLHVAGTREQILARATVQAEAVQSAADPLSFQIVATAPGSGDGTTVTITVAGSGVLVPGGDVNTTNDAARWSWGFYDVGQTAQAQITRSDTGGCTRLAIEAPPTYAGTYLGFVPFPITDATGGVAATYDVPFVATVLDDGTLQGSVSWSAHHEFGQGIGIDMTIEAACTGSVGARGAVVCAGDWLATSVTTPVAFTFEDPGTFTVTGAIVDDVLTGTLDKVGPIGPVSFPITATKQPA